VALTARDDPRALRIHLPSRSDFRTFQKLRPFTGGGSDTGRLQQRGREIHEVDEIIDHASALTAGNARRERHAVPKS
jgi:hypothetical protein